MAAKKAPVRARANKRSTSKRTASTKPVTTKRTRSKPVTPPAKPDPKPEPTGPVYLNDGHRRICELPGNATEIASQVGVSNAMVRQIRKGTKSPGPDLQRRLESEFGIPVRAWGVRPGAEISSSPLAASGGVSGQSLQDVELGLEVCRSVLRDPDTSTRDKLDASQRIRHLTESHAKLTGDNRSALQKLLQSPEWVRFKRQLGDALMKHPEAAKDVEAVLRVLDSEG